MIDNRIGLELSDYLENITMSVFQSGMSAQVVKAKWEGLSKAFSGFDPEKVAGLTTEDVERLVVDEGIIRNRRKIEATIHNAERLLKIDEETGFGRWLGSWTTHEATVSAIVGEFEFVGPTGARLFLNNIYDQLEAC